MENGWQDAGLERDLDQARKEGGWEQCVVMDCGHPRACMRPGSAERPHDANADYCSACRTMDDVQAHVLKAREKLVAGDLPAVMALLDGALAKLFRPIAINGKPPSETIIEDRR